MMRAKHVVVATVLAMGFIVPGPAYGQFDALKRLTQRTPAPTVHKIAYFKIADTIVESPSPMPPIFGGAAPTSMKSLLSRFKKARQDSDVRAVVLDIGHSTLGAAQVEELHAALMSFRAVDKDVYVNSDTLTNWTYALSTAASHISLVPTGDIWLTGLYSESPYIRGALDKLGIVPVVEHCGDFKSAGEFLYRTGPSKPAEEMYAWLFDGLYDGLVGLIATGRNMKKDHVLALIDNGPYSAEEALKAGMIDAIQHRQDFIADLKSRYGKDVEVVTDYGQDDDMAMPEDNFFAMFEFMMNMMNPTPKVYTEPSVAIVYVEGSISTGEAKPSPFGQSDGAYSTSIRKALDEAASEDTVKAVVLRVDSPGGSALASEIILDATKRVAAKKPLIVSMGNVAGSGGYYVTCASDMIFADRNTITASIGVISGKLVTTDAWDSIGINWHSRQRGKMAGMMSTSTTYSDEERAKIRHYMTNVYDIFKGHVVAARGDLLTKPIDELAEGRVFTGAQALELGLIDKIGGLSDAIKYAANRAKLGDYDIRVIPEPPSLFDTLLGKDRGGEFVSTLQGKMSMASWPMFKTVLPVLSTLDPMRVQSLMQAFKRIELIHQERVIMMMPEDIRIR